MLILGTLALFISQSYAGILINTSRVIFNANQHERVISLANTNDYPVLTQLWISNGTEGPDFTETPYLALPAISRMDPKQVVSARIISNGLNLADDRESLHWLNVYELPAISQSIMNGDYIQFAMHTQLKVIHRPKSLSAPMMDKLVKKMIFRKVANPEYFTIEIENKSPYYISIIDIHFIKDGSRFELNHDIDNSLAPYSIKPYASSYRLDNVENNATDNLEILFHLIDDHGLAISYQAII